MAFLKTNVVFSLLISLCAFANQEGQATQYRWETDNQDGTPITLSESGTFLVKITTSSNNNEHIFFFSRKENDRYCSTGTRKNEVAESVKFNNVLVKMSHACTESNDHYYLTLTREGYMYILNQLGTKNMVYMASPDMEQAFDKFNTNGFNEVFKKYLTRQKHVTGGI